MSNSSFVVTGEEVENGSNFIASKSNFTDIITVEEIIVEDTFEVYWERDSDNDGNYEISILLDTLEAGITSGNNIPVNEHQNVRLRFKNVSGNSADVAVVGDIE